jgi:hypothetical protein
MDDIQTVTQQRRIHQSGCNENKDPSWQLIRDATVA